MTKRFRPYNHNCNIRISIILNYDREFALLKFKQFIEMHFKIGNIYLEGLSKKQNKVVWE